MSNVYCLMYNDGFGLAAEAFSFKNKGHANSLIAIGYVNIQADFGQFE